MRRIGEEVARKTLQPQQAGIAMPAGAAFRIRIVATGGEAVIHAEFQPLPDDFCLGEPDEGCVDF